MIEVIGSEGQGPEELQSARYFGYDQDQNIIVDDKPAAFIKSLNRSTGRVTSFESPFKDGFSITSNIMQMCNNFWYVGIMEIGEKPFQDVPVIGKFNQEFELIDLFGGYDPFFEGRRDIMQETLISVDCENGLIFTMHYKTPFIQIYNMEDQELLHRISKMPDNFMLSDKFYQMVPGTHQYFEFLTTEQSLSSLIAFSDSYIYLIFREEKMSNKTRRELNDRIYYAAVYDRNSYTYLGETKLDGAVIGYTKDGYLIMVKDEEKGHIQFVDIKIE